MKELPLFCLGPVSWYTAALRSGGIVLAMDETFPKQTLRNRIVVPTANNVKTLSIPIDGSTKHSIYKDVKISYSEDWVKQWLQTLATAYGKSPFYEFYDYRLEAIFMAKPQYLFDLNLNLLQTSLDMLKAELIISESESRFEEGDAYWENRSLDLQPYTQVFIDRHGFVPHVSIVDLIFNKGPNALEYLMQNEKGKMQK